ncbi:MAG: hypothetical protein HN952_02310 [Candidatus Cloacimonetes bacterium]|jgi:hypothetical protein|nr:hypothetical protein [Candidatus Cloacimonadota bacterium]MBT6993765.1 hypothetical protein [Candidatus Cloacimonadota bacterium]MBT7469935.1 hypothetical protein [Candidatus Cloacimonadota bacterium]
MKFKLWLVLFLLFANLCLNAESFELHNFDEIELKFIGVSIQNIIFHNSNEFEILTQNEANVEVDENKISVYGGDKIVLILPISKRYLYKLDNRQKLFFDAKNIYINGENIEETNFQLEQLLVQADVNGVSLSNEEMAINMKNNIGKLFSDCINFFGKIFRTKNYSAKIAEKYINNDLEKKLK